MVNAGYSSVSWLNGGFETDEAQARSPCRPHSPHSPHSPLRPAALPRLRARSGLGLQAD